MVNKLKLNEVSLKDEDGNEVNLTTKLIAELKSRPENERTEGNLKQTSARS